MPPPNGYYIIFHQDTSSYVGLSEDNTRVVGYNKLVKAQVWEVRAGGAIVTTLRNGQTGGIIYNYDNAYYVGIAPAGKAWSFTYLGANMWTIFDSPNYPTWFITATNVGGLDAQNATVNYSNTTASGSRWLFLPYSGEKPIQSTQIIPHTIVGDSFSVSSQAIRAITQDMVTSFKAGLESQQIPPSSMIPTYVTLVPDGTERGPFLALTLADRLTVSYFELDGASDTTTSQQRSFGLTSQQLALEATELFKYIAQCIKKAVVDDWRLSISEEEPLYMGMVFPFPATKTALNTGILLRWTKDVLAQILPDSTIGQDVVKLLQAALDNEGLHIICNALINDTTATLLAQAYESGGCEIGAIFDSGTNGAYIEEAANIKSLPLVQGQGISGRMVVNTEWGSFEKSQSLERTPFDHRIDRESAYPGQQIFEKLVSTSSIGELTRLVIIHYLDTGNSPYPPKERPLFNRRSSTKLNTKGAINIELMWEIDNAQDAAAAQQLLVRKLNLPSDNVTVDDGKAVKGICRAILLRTARLSACALAATLILMGRAALGGGVERGGRIGINGSLTRSAAFRRDMEEALREIIGANVTKNVLIVQVKRDRTSLGAAVCAYQANITNSN